MNDNTKMLFDINKFISDMESKNILVSGFFCVTESGCVHISLDDLTEYFILKEATNND